MRQKGDRKQGFGRKRSRHVRRVYPAIQQEKMNTPITKFLTPVPGYIGVLSTPQIPPTELSDDVAYQKAVLCNIVAIQ